MEKNASEGFAQHYGQEFAIGPLPFWGHDNRGVGFPDISAKTSGWKSPGLESWGRKDLVQAGKEPGISRNSGEMDIILDVTGNTNKHECKQSLRTANVQKGPGVSLFILHPSFKLSPADNI